MECYPIMSLRDPITGLPTFELLKDRLVQSMAHHLRMEKKAVLLFLESRTKINDDFRSIISKRLEQSVRSTDTVAMLNNATFIVLLTDLNDSADALRVADNLINQCQAPYIEDSMRYRPSIGLSVFPDDALNVDDWIRKAGLALENAKCESNGVYTFYTEDMNVLAHHRREQSLNLEKAWARNELHIYGTPIFENVTQTCVGVELALYWDHPGKGLIPAGSFAEMAQTMHFWSKANSRLIQGAMRGAMAHPNLRWTWTTPCIADLDHASILKTFQGDPALMGMKISESFIASHPDVARAAIIIWKHAGGFVSIDDFGQSISNPSEWLAAPIDEVQSSICNSIPFMHCLTDTYGWRCVYHSIDTSSDQDQWRASSTWMLGQGNALHLAQPLEELLLLPSIVMAKEKRQIKGTEHVE